MAANINKTLKIVLLQVVITAVVSSICLNPLQPDGKCTGCVAVQILINGTCFPKITGCFKYSAGRKCSQCQFGYVLSNAECIRQGVFYNRTNLTYIPPVMITNNETLTIQQIKNRIGQQYGYDFSNVHEYFLSKYSGQIGSGNIKDVQKLVTKRGTIFSIVYQSEALNRYQAVAKIADTKIQQWGFNNSNFQKRDPYTADNSIRKVLGDRLKDYFIYQVKQDKDNYTFIYMNPSFDVTRVNVNKNDVQTLSSSKITSQSQNLNDLALEQFYNKYPLYKQFKVSGVKKYDRYTVVNLGSSISFSYKFDGFRFTINDPVDMPLATAFPPLSPGISMPGGFSQFNDFSDARLQTAVKLAASEFPQISDAKIFQAQSQVVSGTNFFIRLRKPITFDQYEFLIWVRIGGVAELVQAKKNSQLIYQDQFNYNTDPIFLNNFSIVQSQSKIANIPSISKVTFKLNGNKRYYKVKFSDRQYAEFQFNLQTKKPAFLSYFVDGQNLLTTIGKFTKIATERSPDVLLGFIRQQNSAITQAVIENIDIKLPTYFVNITTNAGKFRAQIQDKGQLVLNQLLKTSPLTCTNLDMSKQSNIDKIKIFDDFLRANYPLAGFDIKLIQVGVKNQSTITRMLYSNPSEKQIQIFIQEASGQANLLKAAFVNFAYGTLPLSKQSIQYTKIVNLLNRANVTSIRDPLYAESNGTVIHAYFDNGKSTYQVNYEISTEKFNFQVIDTRSYFLVPDGFSLQGLLIPASISIAENVIVKRIVQEALKKFPTALENAELSFVSKANNIYSLMFKNSAGYQKLDVSISSTGQITVGKVSITPYKNGDFSNCRTFDTTGKCLSCSNAEVQYQGNCFIRLEGCKVQAGKICLKCETDFVKSGQACFKQCQNFFK